MSVNPKDLKEIKEGVFHGEEEKNPKTDVQEPIEKERTRLMQLSEISLWLDTYDDIFSDFDPRPYSERALSDDFLSEAKKASKEKTSGRIELRFIVPNEQRHNDLEVVIRKRLHEHFRKHASQLEEEAKTLRRRGVFTAASGFALMMIASYISWRRSDSFIYSMLMTILEPSGWFITWFGLDQLFYTSNQKKPDLEFYRKMAKCDIEFISLTCEVDYNESGKKP
jgi:hypothetical protein